MLLDSLNFINVLCVSFTVMGYTEEFSSFCGNCGGGEGVGGYIMRAFRYSGGELWEWSGTWSFIFLMAWL